jgi:uncharacterized membrane protein YcgQ (UPF0703/DUF1980 family)
MINIFAFLLFWAISSFSKGGRLVKKAPLAALAALCLFSGCGNTKTILPKSNAAGTLSVSAPMAAPAAVTQPAAAFVSAPAAASQAAPVVTSGEAPAPALSLESKEETVVEIKEKMFIAQTNDVYLNPEDYLGKTIKLEGLFKAEQYGDQSYCFVIRYGPGCCGNDGNAGFEVAWDNQDAVAYPATDEWVGASGVLKTYEEDGYPYLYLALASLDVLDTRGAEFVSQ